MDLKTIERHAAKLGYAVVENKKLNQRNSAVRRERERNKGLLEELNRMHGLIERARRRNDWIDAFLRSSKPLTNADEEVYRLVISDRDKLRESMAHLVEELRDARRKIAELEAQRDSQ